MSKEVKTLTDLLDENAYYGICSIIMSYNDIKKEVGELESEEYLMSSLMDIGSYIKMINEK